MVTVKPHKRLIKFRKSSKQTESLDPVQPSTVVQEEEEQSDRAVFGKREERVAKKKQPEVALEWWEKPMKYNKRGLDDREMEVINSGGADEIFQ